MNKQLEKIFKEDQLDRKNPLFNTKPSLFKKRDSQRRKLVKQMMNKGKIKTGKDYYIAALIFHHGPCIAHAKKAIFYAEKSISIGYRKAKWLYAASVDRFLTKQNKKQKFGTQFFKKTPNGDWILLPVDSKTTDKERAKFDVPTLKQMEKFVEKLNKK